MEALLSAILQRRHQQDAKHGGPAHDDIHTAADWISFIHEHADRALDPDDARFDDEMLNVAALALAAIESDRRKRTIPTTARLPLPLAL